MTWDFLAIPASDVDVERLFNSAWDICLYHWGHLGCDTIEKLMLQLTTDHFLVKEEYHQMKENDERDLVKQRFECAVENDDEYIYISDKKDDIEDNDEELGETPWAQAHEETAQISQLWCVQNQSERYAAMMNSEEWVKWLEVGIVLHIYCLIFWLFGLL